MSTYILLDIMNPQAIISISSHTLLFIRYTVFITIFSLIILSIKYYEQINKHLRLISNQLSTISALTKRESEIIPYLMKGHTNKEIAQVLFVEEGTIKTHVKHIFRKLGVKNRTQLTAFMKDTQDA